MSRPTHPHPSGTARPHLGTGGQCTLVGAGPGDPDLLTIKALKAIQAATVLLVDDLVSDAIVAHAREDHPDEACGVVAGPEGTDRPERFIPMLNAARSPTFSSIRSTTRSLTPMCTWMSG